MSTRTDVDERNAQTSREEVAAFMADKPSRYFAYHRPAWRQARTPRWVEPGDTIATWTGDKLADVISREQPWTSSLGDKRQSFRALGINGVTYSGTAYLTAGDYVRMRAVKA